jgi:hypothetical protein
MLCYNLFFFFLDYWFLLGDWLLFWKLLKQHYGTPVQLASMGYDLNAYANIVCTEVCYYHLLNANTSTYSPQNHGAFIELCEMLECIHNDSQEKLGLKDGSFSLLLDTLAYVYCGMDEAPLEKPNLRNSGKGSSSSQFPSSKKKEIILLLIQLLEANKMKYNLISKKLLLCLQMLLPVSMLAPSRKAFFVQWQTNDPSEEKLFGQMNATLEGLLNIFISQPRPQDQLHNRESEIEDRISSLALRQLVYSNMQAESPCVYNDSIILHLPPVYTDNLLEYLLSDSHQHYLQLCWVYEFLGKLYIKGRLSADNVEKCVEMMQKTLISEWPDFELQGLLKRTLDFFNTLWNVPSFRNFLCITLYNILHQSQIREIKGREYVVSFIESEMLDSVKQFLKSEGCSETCKSMWQGVKEDWKLHQNS